MATRLIYTTLQRLPFFIGDITAKHYFYYENGNQGIFKIKIAPTHGSNPMRDWETCKGSTNHVSWLLNFFVITLPSSMPSRSQIRCASSTCDVPQKILMFGIFLRTSGTDSNWLEPTGTSKSLTPHDDVFTLQTARSGFTGQPQDRVTCFRSTNGAIVLKSVRHRRLHPWT